jgi:hypothetical protein
MSSMRDGKPTVRQIYALAAALCQRADEPFPKTRDEVSDLTERLRLESGHPAPRLEDVPLQRWGGRRRGARRGGRSHDERRASTAAAELVREMR